MGISDSCMPGARGGWVGIKGGGEGLPVSLDRPPPRSQVSLTARGGSVWAIPPAKPEKKSAI